MTNINVNIIVITPQTSDRMDKEYEERVGIMNQEYEDSVKAMKEEYERNVKKMEEEFLQRINSTSIHTLRW